MYITYLTDMYNCSSSDSVARRSLLSSLNVKKLVSRHKCIKLPNVQIAPDSLSDDGAGI